MKRLLLLTLLVLLVPASAHAAITPSLKLDTAFAPLSGIAQDDYSPSVASDVPADVLVVGGRVLTVGSTSADDGNIYIVARRPDGRLDGSYSGDGRAVVSIPGTEAESVKAAVALPDGRLRVAASVDTVIGTTNNFDVAVIGLLPDGSPDPSIGGGSGFVIFPVGAGDDAPNAIAVDGQGRIAVTGSTNTSNVKDTFVSLRNADGSPAAFGTNGVRTIARSPLNLPDEGLNVVFRPGGGLAVSVSYQTNPVGNNTDEMSVLWGLGEDGSDDQTFGVAGEAALAVGDPDTSAPGLLVHRGRIWVTGKTQDGVAKQAFVARVDPNGTGLQSRRFEMRPKNSGVSEAIESSGRDLVVLAGPPETLVVVGGTVTPNSGLGAFAAAAFSNFEADLASAPMGTYVDGGSSQVGVLSAAPEGPYSLVATGLLLNQSSFDTSFATMRFLLDADKKCDLAIDVPTPLELTFVGRKGTAAQISVENKGERPCGGDVTVNAPYKLGRAVSTGVIEPGAKFVTNAVPVTSSTIQRADDVARFSISVPGDGDTSNDVRGVRAVFSFCDLALRAVEKPATIPNEGGRRVEIGLRNAGTRTCRSVRFMVSNGSGEGASKPYSIERGRTVSDDVNVSAKATAKVGKKATVRVTAASSDDDIASGNDAIRLTARVVGVGDTRIGSAGASRVSGSATAGKGVKADRNGIRLSRVEVAIRKLGSGCRWMSGSKFTNRKTTSCTPAGWKRASGTRAWSLSLAKLAKGRYEVYTRAVTANGFKEGRFSARDGNRRAFRVR